MHIRIFLCFMYHNFFEDMFSVYLYFTLFYIAQHHKLQISLKGLYSLYTYDIPVSEPHIGSGKTLKK